MKALIMERLQCSEKRAEIIANDLEKLHPELQPLLERWIKDGHCEDATLYHGYSLDTLMAEKRLKFTGAILTLDWILKDPDMALKALREQVK